jgi:hypothetical protein
MFTENELRLLAQREKLLNKLEKIQPIYDRLREQVASEAQIPDSFSKWWNSVRFGAFARVYGAEITEYEKDRSRVRDPEERALVWDKKNAPPLTDQDRLDALWINFDHEWRDLNIRKEKFPDENAIMDQYELFTKTRREHQDFLSKLKSLDEIVAFGSHFERRINETGIVPLIEFMKNVLSEDVLSKETKRKRERQSENKLFRLLLPYENNNNNTSFLSVIRIDDPKVMFGEATSLVGPLFLFHRVKSVKKSDIVFASGSMQYATVASSFVAIIDGSDNCLYIRNPSSLPVIQNLAKRICDEGTDTFVQWVTKQMGLCWVCLKQLTDQTSIENGMGSVCAKKAKLLLENEK